MDQDFIVTGLLSELKAENIRKDAVIRGLIKVICGVVAAVLVVVAGFLLYLNQYDFGSTTTTTATKALSATCNSAHESESSTSRRQDLQTRKLRSFE